MSRPANQYGETFQSGMVSPTPIHSYLERFHARRFVERTGDVAGCYFGLAKADPESVCICHVTVDGHFYSVGDS